MNDTKPAISRGHRLVSVIIPTYNAANTLAEQLEGLKAQTYDGDWEILIVNNRSTDATVNVVQDYQRVMPNLRLVRAMERQGRAYACNVGAQLAQGGAFIFCDADDVAAHGWLSVLAEALEKHHVVAGAIEVHTLNQSAPWRPCPFNCDGRPILNFLPHAMGCNMAISREAFETVGGFCEDALFIEDGDISWRLQLQGYTIHYVPAAVMHHRYRETLQEMCKQIVSYSAAHVCLFKRFAVHGMPRSSITEALKRYKWLIKRAPFLLVGDRQDKEKWSYFAAFRWGRLLGSLRYRILYL